MTCNQQINNVHIIELGNATRCTLGGGYFGLEIGFDGTVKPNAERG